MKLGLDISSNDRDINFSILKQYHIEFIMVCCSNGLKKDNKYTIDPYFLTNIEKIIKYNLNFGIYFYSYAFNSYQASQEGIWVKNLIIKNNINPKYPIMFAFMDSDLYKIRNNFDFSNQNCTDICSAFLNEIKPLNGGIYAYSVWLQRYINWQKLKYPIWCANHINKNEDPLNKSTEYNFINAYIWQYTQYFIIHEHNFNANILFD